jgi:hypothetical protein
VRRHHGDPLVISEVSAYYLDCLSRYLVADAPLAREFVGEMVAACRQDLVFSQHTPGRLVAVVLDAYRHAGAIKAGLEFWEELAGLTPPYPFNPNHYVCRTELLLRAGHVDQAAEELRQLRRAQPQMVSGKLYARFLTNPSLKRHQELLAEIEALRAADGIEIPEMRPTLAMESVSLLTSPSSSPSPSPSPSPSSPSSPVGSEVADNSPG